MTHRTPTVVATLYHPSALLPMGEPAGVGLPLADPPSDCSRLRPFVATLAVPMPPAAKHSTTSTSPRTDNRTERSMDGKVITDNQTDTGSDS